jgi:hypothetical protein
MLWQAAIHIFHWYFCLLKIWLGFYQHSVLKICIYSYGFRCVSLLFMYVLVMVHSIISYIFFLISRIVAMIPFQLLMDFCCTLCSVKLVIFLLWAYYMFSIVIWLLIFYFSCISLYPYENGLCADHGWTLHMDFLSQTWFMRTEPSSIF